MLDNKRTKLAFTAAEALPAPSMELIVEMIESDDNRGLCLACSAEAYNVEPDARRYKCESCGQRAVYGAEELLLMYGA